MNFVLTKLARLLKSEFHLRWGLTLMLQVVWWSHWYKSHIACENRPRNNNGRAAERRMATCCTSAQAKNTTNLATNLRHDQTKRPINQTNTHNKQKRLKAQRQTYIKRHTHKRTKIKQTTKSNKQPHQTIKQLHEAKPRCRYRVSR